MVANVKQWGSSPAILSLFSGCGGLDLGFVQAGYEVGLAYDLRASAVNSYNHFQQKKCAFVRDVSEIKLKHLDQDFGGKFLPHGVIGGPPCQSFSRGNSSKKQNDPRTKMVKIFFDLALRIHRHRGGLDFIVMENVPEVSLAEKGRLLGKQIDRLVKHGFDVHSHVYNALEHGVAQKRRRLILVAINSSRKQDSWIRPSEQANTLTVRDLVFDLPDPVFYDQSKVFDSFPEHPNHWCMTPRSRKFSDRTLKPGRSTGRSFKTLDWDKPSYTVSYGHREVHVHPDCHRRLSVYEAMLLQGFPKNFVMMGTLSEQFSQISEAVPPPLAKAIAQSIGDSIYAKCCASKSARAVA